MSNLSDEIRRKLWNLICGEKKYRINLENIEHKVINGPIPVILGNYLINDLGDYSIERIVLGSPKISKDPLIEPGDKFEKVPCFILRPKDKEKPKNGFPAVICLHQHGGDYTVGKSEVVGLSQNVLLDGYYDYGAKLAKEGFIVIAPDFKCFEERRSLQFEAMSKYDAKTAPEAYERFVAMNYLLYGTTFQRRMILDIKTVVDYLCNGDIKDDIKDTKDDNKDVKCKKQIGCIGHSLGGTEAIFAAALIPDIKAVVASCGISTYRAIRERCVNHNFAFYIPKFLNGWGKEDLGILFNSLDDSQSLFILAGEKDSNFPMEGLKELCENRNGFYDVGKDLTEDDLRNYDREHGYVKYDRKGSLYWIVPKKKHEFSSEMQWEAIKFLDRKLKSTK